MGLQGPSNPCSRPVYLMDNERKPDHQLLVSGFINESDQLH